MSKELKCKTLLDITKKGLWLNGYKIRYPNLKISWGIMQYLYLTVKLHLRSTITEVNKGKFVISSPTYTYYQVTGLLRGRGSGLSIFKRVIILQN